MSTKQKINVFEKIIIWSLLQSIQNVYLMILSLNVKAIVFAESMARFAVLFTVFCLLTPALTLWLISSSMGLSNKWHTLWFMLVNTMLYVAVEYMLNLLHIITYQWWNIGYSLIFWSSIILFVYAFFQLARWIAQKDVKM